MEDFRLIQFGKADAQTEVAEMPTLLKAGYFERDGLIEKAINSSVFLFLGYKGAGKTALSEHMNLISEDSEMFIDQVSLVDFSYKSFPKIVTGDDELEIKTKVAWKWLLLVRILYSLINDTTAHFDDRQKLEHITQVFVESGIFPVKDLSSLVTKSSSHKVQATFRNLGYEYNFSKENISVSVSMVIDLVEELVLSVKESKQHFIIIDGLDDILTSRNVQYVTIASLINVARNLNALFKKKHLLFKIMVLCRTDIFERLPDPNKNKIRTDCSYSFDWYNEGIESQDNCGLVEIANRRTTLTYPEIQDVFQTFFPATYGGKKVKSVLLDMTRHTPRDFLQLLCSIQSQCGTCMVTEADIQKGINEYSMQYFLPEIKDEMVGYVPYKLIDPILTLLSSFHSREFSYKQVENEFAKSKVLRQSGISLLDILTMLYECSAIGNTYSYNGGRETRLTFKYRNRTSSFNSSNNIVLHKGLWKALNVNF